MLMDLGANVYSEDFEQHFLAKAAEFYQVHSHLFLVMLVKCTSDLLNETGCRVRFTAQPAANTCFACPMYSILQASGHA